MDRCNPFTSFSLHRVNLLAKLGICWRAHPWSGKLYGIRDGEIRVKIEGHVEVRCVFEVADVRVQLRCIHVHVPGGSSGTLSGRAQWELLARLLLAYCLRMSEKPTCAPVHLDKDDASFEGSFDSVWRLVKNQLNQSRTKGTARPLQDDIHGIEQHSFRGQPVSISIDPMQLPAGNVTFSLATGLDGTTRELTQRRDLQTALDALSGRNLCALSDVGAAVSLPGRQEPFRFGSEPTRTYVAHDFPDGLALEYVECHRVNEDFEIPSELKPLVWQASELIATSASAGHTMTNAPVFAPVKVEVVSNFGEDSNFQKVMIWLANSHYELYSVAAFADTLAARDARFQPLQRFVNKVTDYRLPSPASCSLGTRIMLETADKYLVVSYRSQDCKMNADVWSVSANEGVRPSVLKAGGSFSNLLDLAARAALYNEMRIDSGRIEYLVLLSLHQNAFAQWGATLYAKSSLNLSDVLQRQRRADHRFEHSQVAGISVNLDECGKDMAKLGRRWYGGALEAICSTLAFRELAKRNHVTPEEVGRILVDNGGRGIQAIDEVNERFLKKIA